MDALRPYLARFLASWIAAAAVFINSKYGITLDGDTQAAIITLALGIFSTVYGIAHKTIDKKLNPGDAASSHMAVKELGEHERMVS